MDYTKDKRIPTKTLLCRFAPYLFRFRGILILDLFCAALTTVSEMILPMILRYLTNTGLTNLASITLPIILQLTGFYLGLKAIELVAGYFMANIGHVMGARIETFMRHDIFNHLQNLSDSYYNNTKVGQIMSRITNDLFEITEFSHHCPEEYFIGTIKITVAFVILYTINKPLTLVIFSMIPLMIFFSSRFNHRMRKNFKNLRNHIGELNARIEDSLLGVKVVKSFANEPVELKKFEQDNQKFLAIKRDTYRSLAGFFTVTRAFDGIMYMLVILLGGLFLIDGSIMPGDLVAFTLYVTTLLSTVRRIVEFTEQFQRGMTGIERFMEVMDTESEINDMPGAIELTRVEGKIEFRNVSFTYHDNKDTVLRNVQLTIEPAKHVALVGPSGSGKTTLCNLIPRFYDVSAGEILIDGRNIKDFTLQSLRSHIGMVQQDVYLFSGSVYDNIAYGKPNATYQEVEEAARLAGAYEFIRQLPQGFQSYVGERGVKLSGGQKQRISIARVFLKNPPILILDEATSALDNQSEKIIQRSLEHLCKGRTTISIAHRLTTIQNADQILVLTEEGIVEQGSHKELMDRKGLYYELYNQAYSLDQPNKKVFT